MIACAVQSFITDSTPDVIYKEGEDTVAYYSQEKQKQEILKVYPSIFELRKKELEKFLETYKKTETEE